MAKPTVDEILSIRKGLADIWERARIKWREWEELHDLGHAVITETPVTPVKLAWARSKVNNMVDNLITHKPKVHREPTGKGEVKEKMADDIEKWAEGVLWKVAVEQSVIPPFRAAGQYISLLGDVKMPAKWNSSAWPKEPKRGRGYKAAMEDYERVKGKAFPFLIECPHPARILVPPGERVPSMAIELASVYNWQVKKQYPGIDGLRDKPFDLLELLIYCDEDWWSIIIDGREALSYPNGLHIVPYAHAYSGKGMERSPVSIDGLGAGTKEQPNMGPRPEDLAEGLLAGQEASIKAADNHMTATTFLALKAAYPRLFALPGSGEGLRKSMDEAGVGGVAEVLDPTKPISEQIMWEQLPNLAPWVFQPLSLLKESIDIGTFSGVVGGEIAPRLETATGQAMRLGAARMSFGMPLMQLNYMAGLLLGFCARMMAERGETVTINGISISGDDFDKCYDFEVDFWAKDEGEKMRNADTVIRLYGAGLLDEETALSKLGEEDVSGIQERKLVDKAMKNPQVLGPIIEAAASTFKQRHGIAPAQVPEPTVTTTAASVSGEEQPASLIPLPGGEQEGRQVEQGMSQVPGEGIGRVIPL